MKKLIESVPVGHINVASLTGRELVAYRSKGCKNGYCVLSKLNSFDSSTAYGFTPLNNSDSNPRFISRSWHGAIKIAMVDRELYVFTDMQDLLNAMATQKF